jgi:long-chain acyl-CoA synthetase
MNLAHECLEKTAARVGTRTAMVACDTGETLSYLQFNSRVNSIANALVAMGIRKGDRVAIYLPNIPQFLISVLAIMKTGAVYVPFNIMNKRQEIEYVANNCGARILIAATEPAQANVLPILSKLPSVEKVILVEDVPENLKSDTVFDFDEVLAAHSDEFSAVDMAPEDPISILYTSGTTGRPKGAVASHQNWTALTTISAYQVVPMTDDDVVLGGFPYFHVGIVIAVLPVFLVGGTAAVLTRFAAPDALQAITKYGITHFMGAPTMWTYLVDEYDRNKSQYDVSSLRQGQCAGALLPPETGRRIQSTFGIGLIECYGATECSSTVTHTRFGHWTPGSAGWPTPGWEIKIIDDDGNVLPNGEIGELCCKGPGVVSEYWNDPEKTAKTLVDGWWHSGDLAMMKGGGSTMGHLHMVDRKDDMILCGGYNIYPLEVENYITQHPKVLLALVIGISDKVKGQIPKAFIVLEAGETATAEEIKTYCRENLSAYKIPRSFEIVDLEDIPKNPSGKVLKRELRRIEEEKMNA